MTRSAVFIVTSAVNELGWTLQTLTTKAFLSAQQSGSYVTGNGCRLVQQKISTNLLNVATSKSW